MWIDVHTHQSQSDADICIRSLVFGRDIVQGEEVYSIGIHPLHLEALKQEDWAAFEALATDTRAIAIGECGIDRRAMHDLKTQSAIFVNQIQLAEALQKPLVIHCVRTISECIALLRGLSVPVIFHGFNLSLRKAELLIAEGFYMSFGKSLLYNKQVQSSLSELPLRQIFFETDEADISIRTVYNKASELLNIPLQQLQHQITENFNIVFKR